MCHTFFACCAHWHARIACQCVFDLHKVQKCATKSDISGHCLVPRFQMIRFGCFEFGVWFSCFESKQLNHTLKTTKSYPIVHYSHKNSETPSINIHIWIQIPTNSYGQGPGSCHTCLTILWIHTHHSYTRWIHMIISYIYSYVYQFMYMNSTWIHISI